MPSTDHNTPPAPRLQAFARLFPYNPKAADSEAASPTACCEAEHRKQQTLLDAAMATIEHFFGPCSQWLARVSDPRDPGKIIYPLPAVLFTGLWLFLCRLGSRRQVT